MATPSGAAEANAFAFRVDGAAGAVDVSFADDIPGARAVLDDAALAGAAGLPDAADSLETLRLPDFAADDALAADTAPRLATRGDALPVAAADDLPGFPGLAAELAAGVTRCLATRDGVLTSAAVEDLPALPGFAAEPPADTAAVRVAAARDALPAAAAAVRVRAPRDLPGVARSPPRSLIGLSSRKRLKAACRSRPCLAQPRNATSAINTGRTQCTSRGRPGMCAGNSSVGCGLCNACNCAVISPSRALSKPVPTRPT